MPTPRHAHLISTREASERSGYHPDYLARLCRSKKIDGMQIGRAWIVDLHSLASFVEEQERLKKIRAAELSRAREAEYRLAQVIAVPESTAAAIVTVPLATISPYQLIVEKTSRPLVFSPILAFVFSVALVGGVAYVGNSAVLTNALARTGALALQFATSEAVTGEPHFRTVMPEVPADHARSYVVRMQPTEALLSSRELVETHERIARAVAFDTPRIDTRETGFLVAQELRAQAQLMLSDRALVHAVRPDRIAHAAFSFVRAQAERIQRGHLVLVTAAGEHLLSIGSLTRDTSNEVARVQPGGKLANAILTSYTRGVETWVEKSPQVAERGVRIQLALGTTVLERGEEVTRYLDTPSRNLAGEFDGELVALAGKAAPWHFPEPVVVFGERIAASVYGSLQQLVEYAGSIVVEAVEKPTPETELTGIRVVPEVEIRESIGKEGQGLPSADGLVNTQSPRTLTVRGLKAASEPVVSGTITATGAINGAYFTSASVTATSSAPKLASNSFALSNEYFTDLTGDGLIATEGSLGESGTTESFGTIDTTALEFIRRNAPRLTFDTNGTVGISTTTPATQLTPNGDVQGDLSVSSDEQRGDVSSAHVQSPATHSAAYMQASNPEAMGYNARIWILRFASLSTDSVASAARLFVRHTIVQN